MNVLILNGKILFFFENDRLPLSLPVPKKDFLIHDGETAVLL